MLWPHSHDILSRLPSVEAKRKRQSRPRSHRVTFFELSDLCFRPSVKAEL
jgi:hypothetical protein